MKRWTNRRVAIAAIGVGVVAGALCWLAYRLPPPSTSDLDQLLLAARALFRGENPYAAVAGRQFYPLFYPLPAVLIAAPFALLPNQLAHAAWAAVSAAALAVAAIRWGRGLPPVLLSASFLNAVVLGQWSPLLTAGLVIPSIGALWVAKPSVGAALLVARPTRVAIFGGGAILLASLAAWPSWPKEWLHTLAWSAHRPPVLRPGGAILLLALLRWRTPEGRLVAALACVPQTVGFYETVPLFLVARTRYQGYLLAALSYVAAFSSVLVFPRAPGMTLEAVLDRRWPLLLLFSYIPALILLLAPQGLGPGAGSPPTEPGVETDTRAGQGTNQ